MRLKKWIAAENIGQLMYEKVLVRFDIPLLFTCLDEDKNRYLTVCSDEETGEYVAVRITDAKLLDMLQNIETMYDTFRGADEIALIRYIPGENGYVWNNTDQKCVSDEMLPDKGEYFGLYNEKIRNFAAELSGDIPDR